MAKSPGFWFFTGDWLKDPELRFCSIFARGLLVDLLCILFEAKEQGYASKPDGTARSDEEIVSAVSGGDLEEKLSALAELERSGVLSRDNRGVLFSRRLSRLSEISNSRSKAGSKGGSKTQAKQEQNAKQTGKQKRGVSVSDSDSVSTKNTPEDFLTAEWMWEAIKRVNPEQRPPTIASWANTIRLMRERDNRTDQRIREVFEFANRDEFWSRQILSAENLRSKFDKLTARMDKWIIDPPRISLTEQRRLRDGT